MESLIPYRSKRNGIIYFRLLLLAAIFLNALVLLMLTGRPNPVGPQLTPGPTGTETPGTGPNVSAGFRGVNVPVWGPDFGVAVPSIDRAARLGANSVALVSHWYVSTAAPYTGGGIFREEGSAGAGANRTASDESLALAIDAAHEAGLTVMLKPHVDWTEGGWRGWFYFADDAGREDWWTSYGEMISSTVQLAMDHGVEVICIGTEFGDINKEPASAARWTAIIKQIRKAGYTGKLTYAANWGPYNDAEYDRPGLQGVWEQLDYVGVDAYYPISNEIDPTLEQLVAGWRNATSPWDEKFKQNNFAQIERLHRRTGKDVIFTEIGYPATDYTGKNPGSGGEGNENDAAQARAIQAAIAVWGDVAWLKGMFWWQDGPTFNALSIAGRPAEDVLSEHWQQPKAGAKTEGK